ncbi:MAG TPA: IS4 family transposase [Candidatus Acidoferrales bacterium]|nr:IS4 family transposase [Candidatus Acidoferrales bacterium]
MNSGRTVFSQLIQHLPEKEFQKCVDRHNGDSNFRGFSCWDQLLAMAFAQLTYRESLRDIESCLRALGSKLYHMGFRGKVSRSTLADANESHDWRIFAEFAQVLIGIARPLHAHDPIGVDLDQSLYALDSRTIDLCLSLFPWAKFRQRKAAVKMHTLLDLHGNIPTFIRVTSGDVHDVNILDEIMPEAGAFYVMDRGYIDFQRLFVFTLSSAFFVVRTKSNVLIQRRYSHPVDKTTGVRSDQTVILTSFESASAYPDALRRVNYLDKETHKRLKFLTNNFVLPAFTIAQIYKCRWQVELFFKWIKQHLRIKAFYGTSENAVKTQIWIAVSIYVLVAIVRKRLGLAASLYQTLQILSITLFEKTPILYALQAPDADAEFTENVNQLILFEK